MWWLWSWKLHILFCAVCLVILAAVTAVTAGTLSLQEESLQSVQSILNCNASVARALLIYYQWDAERLFGACDVLMRRPNNIILATICCEVSACTWQDTAILQTLPYWLRPDILAGVLK